MDHEPFQGCIWGQRLQKSLSQRLAPAFHKKYREGLSDKNMAVYKKPLPEKYDPIKELKEFWTKHNLSQYRTDWLKIAKSKNLFTFWRGTVSDGLFDWAIDNYFIKGHTNNHIEGMFNYVDEYTKAQMDHQRMEYALQHVRGRLVTHRTARRHPSLRSTTRGGNTKKARARRETTRRLL